MIIRAIPVFKQILFSSKTIVRHKSQFSGVDLKMEHLEGKLQGVTLLSMARASAKNAMGSNMMEEFKKALKIISFDPLIRVVVLQSIVPRADLKERIKMTPNEAAETVYNFRSIFTELEQLPMPTIAAIEGAALGGGLEMAMSLDFRVSGSKAILGAPETGLAIIPGAGGTQRLPRLIGASKAKELIFTARRIDSVTAEKIGLVDYAVDEGKALERAFEIAKEILPNGPIGVRMAKEAISKGIQVDLASGMAIERSCYAQVIPTKDRLEGLAAFKEKRKPVFEGK